MSTAHIAIWGISLDNFSEFHMKSLSMEKRLTELLRNQFDVTERARHSDTLKIYIFSFILDEIPRNVTKMVNKTHPRRLHAFIIPTVVITNVSRMQTNIAFTIKIVINYERTANDEWHDVIVCMTVSWS